MEKQHEWAVWWIKRDIRLRDNAALAAAVAEARWVVPVFIFEPSVVRAADTSAFHIECLRTALAGLRAGLRPFGSDVVVLSGEVEEALSRLQTVIPFTAVFSHEETGNGLTYRRDRRVGRWLRDRSVTWIETPTNGVVRRLPSRDARYPLWRERMEAATLPVPDVPPLPAPVRSWVRPLPSAGGFGLSLAGARLPRTTEAEAWRTLESFLERRAHDYSWGISSPNTALHVGSRLSTHLAWGTVSLRSVYQATSARLSALAESGHPDGATWARSLAAFRARLAWRDHFVQRLESEPAMEFHPLNRSYEAVPYTNQPERLAAFLAGQTGFPLVDACMRCYRQTGFLNFRMRAMLVSFACHALHLDWRLIHPPLARLWADYEPGIHLSQLQMQAGVVGTGAIRVYNPTKQLEEHDLRLRFTRRWVPELRDANDEAVLHGLRDLAPGYPPPLVDFAGQTRRMKEALYAIRRTPSAQALTQEVQERHGSRWNGEASWAAPPVRRAAAPKGRPPATPYLPDPAGQLLLFVE